MIQEEILIFYLVKYLKGCKTLDTILVRVNKEFSANREKELENQLIKELAHITGEITKEIKLVTYTRKI